MFIYCPSPPFHNNNTHHVQAMGGFTMKYTTQSPAQGAYAHSSEHMGKILPALALAASLTAPSFNAKAADTGLDGIMANPNNVVCVVQKYERRAGKNKIVNIGLTSFNQVGDAKVYDEYCAPASKMLKDASLNPNQAAELLAESQYNPNGKPRHDTNITDPRSASILTPLSPTQGNQVWRNYLFSVNGAEPSKDTMIRTNHSYGGLFGRDNLNSRDSGLATYIMLVDTKTEPKAESRSNSSFRLNRR